MPEIFLRQGVSRQTTIWATIAGCSIGGMLVLAGIVLLFGGESKMTMGLQSLASGMSLIVFSIVLNGLVHVSAKTDDNVRRVHGLLLDIKDSMHRMEPHMKMLAENSQISDAVRSITHRDSEREALRQAIREEMYRSDWEAAAYLITEMERRFGYKQEAEALREELAGIRVMTIEEKIASAVRQIEKTMSDRNWDRARAEIERLMKLFPRHERVMSLPKDLASKRESQKQELLTKWKQAVARNEIDEGIAVLTELDQYLSRSEAQHLQDEARDVFKARLLNLGVQFGLAVSEHRWRDALETGLQIRSEFPNSRMAQEVSQRIETLRIRSGFKADAEITLRNDQNA